MDQYRILARLMVMLGVAVLIIQSSTVSAAPARPSATITVNTIADNVTAGDGFCTLREALYNSDTNTDNTSGDCAAGSGEDLIQFSISGVIVVTPAGGGYLPIGDNVTIDGGNAITLSGGNTLNIFYVNTGLRLTLNNIILTNGYSGSNPGGAVYVNGATLILNNTTIQNSRTNNQVGGAIYAAGGAVTLNNSVVQGNTDYNYGAIQSSSGAVTLTNSIVRNNVATQGGGALNVDGIINISGSQIYSNTASVIEGGAIRIVSPGKVTISNSQIYSNRALAYFGGGIYNYGTLTVTQSNFTGNTAAFSAGAVGNENTVSFTDVSFSGNSSPAGTGGAITNGSSGQLTLTNSTISGNSAALQGGAINNFGGTVTLTNVTISGNSHVNANQYAVRDVGGTMNLTNVTINNNIGGGVGHSAGGGGITLRNTIIASSSQGSNCALFPGSSSSFTSAGFNLSSDNSCTPYFNQPGDWNNTNPYLGALTNNGGPTATHMIFPPSQAIDGGSSCPSLDQRGIARVGLACDIGAVEYQPGVPTPFLWLPFIVR